MLSGCAARGRSFAERFVKQGEPKTDLGGPSIGDASKAAAPAAAAPVPVPQPVPDTIAAGTTVESSDPRLAASLLVETAQPTVGNHVAVAQEYLRLGILDAAFSHASQALDLDSSFSEAHELIARIWRDWGFPTEGLGAAHRAVYYAPQSASAENTFGTLLDAIGRPDLAYRAYRRAFELDPSAGWTLNNACYSEFRIGHLASARQDCEAALAIDPGLKTAHNNLGLVLAASGDLARAKDEFLAAGDSAAAEYNLGMVYLADRQYAEAADRFERALKARPDFAAARSRAHEARKRAVTGGR